MGEVDNSCKPVAMPFSDMYTYRIQRMIKEQEGKADLRFDECSTKCLGLSCNMIEMLRGGWITCHDCSVEHRGCYDYEIGDPYISLLGGLVK